jgi:hypothetical protein
MSCKVVRRRYPSKRRIVTGHWRIPIVYLWNVVVVVIVVILLVVANVPTVLQTVSASSSERTFSNYRNPIFGVPPSSRQQQRQQQQQRWYVQRRTDQQKRDCPKQQQQQQLYDANIRFNLQNDVLYTPRSYSPPHLQRQQQNHLVTNPNDYSTSNIHLHSCNNDPSQHRQFAMVQLVVASTKNSHSIHPKQQKQQQQKRSSNAKWMVQPTNTELTWIGNAVAGTMEIVTSTLLNYGTGYVTGYVIGTIIGIPQSIFFSKPSNNLNMNSNNHPINNHLSSWIRQVHTKSHVQYGQQWGHVSMVFGGSRTVVQMLSRCYWYTNHNFLSSSSSSIKAKRTYQNSETYTEIMSSVLAGAIMARKGMSMRLLF